MKIEWGRGHIGIAGGRAWTTGPGAPCPPNCEQCRALGIIPAGASYEEVTRLDRARSMVSVSAVNHDGTLERVL